MSGNKRHKMSELDLEIQRLREQNAKLAAMNEALLAEQARLLAQAEEMQAAINSLRSMMAWFRKKLFGSIARSTFLLIPMSLSPHCSTSPCLKRSRPNWMRR